MNAHRLPSPDKVGLLRQTTATAPLYADLIKDAVPRQE